MSTCALPLCAPLALLLGAAALTHRGQRPRLSLQLVEAFALAALVVAIVSATLPGLRGASTIAVPGPGGLGLSVRLDAVSVVMLLLVTFIGWVVLRFAATYLDGEGRQGAFTVWLCLTLASVMVLVLSGNMVQLVVAWITTSLCLHRLLLFYPDRIAARRAARKKMVTARLADIALVSAVILLWHAYRTMDIATILSAARAGSGGGHRISCDQPGCRGCRNSRSRLLGTPGTDQRRGGGWLAGAEKTRRLLLKNAALLFCRQSERVGPRIQTLHR